MNKRAANRMIMMSPWMSHETHKAVVRVRAGQQSKQQRETRRERHVRLRRACMLLRAGCVRTGGAVAQGGR